MASTLWFWHPLAPGRLAILVAPSMKKVHQNLVMVMVFLTNRVEEEMVHCLQLLTKTDAKSWIYIGAWVQVPWLESIGNRCQHSFGCATMRRRPLGDGTSRCVDAVPISGATCFKRLRGSSRTQTVLESFLCACNWRDSLTLFMGFKFPFRISTNRICSFSVSFMDCLHGSLCHGCKGPCHGSHL